MAGPVCAQGGSLTGSWRGYTKGITFNLVVGADQTFSEQQISGSIMTMQQGHVVSAGTGIVSFMVETWAPQTMSVYHPVGTTGGYYTQVPTSKPPGGTWRLTFNSPNTVTMQDVYKGGSIPFQRVP